MLWRLSRLAMAAVCSSAVILSCIPTAHAASPATAQNGMVAAQEYLRGVQFDTCNTDSADLGETFLSSSLTNPQPIRKTDTNGWSIDVKNVSFSPDGSRYAFNTNWSEDLGFSNSDGSNINGTQSFYLISPYSSEYYMKSLYHYAWSPDGLTIAYSDGAGLFQANINGTNVRLVAWGDFEDLSWSPDGSNIAFTQPSITSFETYQQGVDHRDRIGTIHPDGTGLQFFAKASDTSFDQHPSWSPDGTKIVFASNRSQRGTNEGNQPTQLFEMNADGSNVTQLTDDYTKRYEFPAWSPDGTKILTAVTRYSTTDPMSLVTLDAVTGSQTSMYTPPCNVGFSYVSWQPLTNPTLYRMANWKTHERLFTTNASEVFSAQLNNSGWVYEGPAMHVYATEGDSRTPVYRMANFITKERLFTTDANEVQYALSHYAGWVNEGVAFYAGTNTSNTPVYRLANWQTHERLFTTDTHERDTIRDKNGWVYEGVAFYAAE